MRVKADPTLLAFIVCVLCSAYMRVYTVVLYLCIFRYHCMYFMLFLPVRISLAANRVTRPLTVTALPGFGDIVPRDRAVTPVQRPACRPRPQPRVDVLQWHGVSAASRNLHSQRPTYQKIETVWLTEQGRYM